MPAPFNPQVKYEPAFDKAQEKSPDDNAKLTQSSPDSFIGGRDPYGQRTDKAERDFYTDITDPDPNGRENPEAGDIVTAKNPTPLATYCNSCQSPVSAESLSDPRTAHLGHDLMYDKSIKHDFDVNQTNANPIGVTGGSYFIQPMNKPSYQNDGQQFPEETKGLTLGDTYRWQTDVDRSSGKGNNAKRPVLPGGGYMDNTKRIWSGELEGHFEDRIHDIDPLTNQSGIHNRGGSADAIPYEPMSKALTDEAGFPLAGPDTIADDTLDKSTFNV